MKYLLTLPFVSIALFGAAPGGPQPGFILDSRTATIRPVLGIAGALRLGDPLSLSSGIAAAEFSLTSDSAVALTADQPAHVLVITGLRTSPASKDLGEVAADARLLPINSKGTSAAFHSTADATLRFITSLSNAPSLSAPILTSNLAGPITAGLLDDSGNCALLGTGAVETLCADGSSRRIIQSSSLSVTALAFANGGRDLWVADSAAKQILQISGYSDQSLVTIAATESDGLLSPVALTEMSTGQILVADSEAQTVFVIGNSAVRAFPMSVVPSRLQPLNDRTLVLLNDLTALPFTLLATEEMRTYFVPVN